MSGNQEKPQTDALETATETSQRRRYRSPKLTHLGSVRELTFGTGQKASDGGGIPTGAKGLM